MDFAQLVDLTNAAVEDTLGGALVTYHRPGFPNAQVVGIFDREHYEASPGEGRVSTTEPSITFRTVALGAAGIMPLGGSAGHEVTLGAAQGSSRWRIIDVQPDGMGMVVCTLHAAEPYLEEDEG